MSGRPEAAIVGEGLGLPRAFCPAPPPPALSRAPSHSLSGSRGHLLCDQPWSGGAGSLEESLTPGTEAPGGPSSVSWCLGVSVSGAAALTPGSPGAPGLVTGDAAGSKGAPSSARAQVITVTSYPG